MKTIRIWRDLPTMNFYGDVPSRTTALIDFKKLQEMTKKPGINFFSLGGKRSLLVRSTPFILDFNEKFKSFSHLGHAFLWKHHVEYGDPTWHTTSAVFWRISIYPFCSHRSLRTGSYQTLIVLKAFIWVLPYTVSRRTSRIKQILPCGSLENCPDSNYRI